MDILNPDYTVSGGNGVYMWQYTNAKRLTKILQNEIDYFGANVRDFITDWQKDVFNLKTANSFGLDLWGRIMSAPRPTSSPLNYVVGENNIFYVRNNTTNKWNSIYLDESVGSLFVSKISEEVSYSPVMLSDEYYRRCLLAKIYLLYSNASVVDINKYLSYIYEGKTVNIIDYYDMNMSVNFGFVPSDIDIIIITSDAFSPRPMGVSFGYDEALFDKTTFGFEQNELATWGKNDVGTPVPSGYGTFY